MTHPGQLLKQSKLYAGKELGQNFLANPGMAKMIVKKIGISKDTSVLEIGSAIEVFGNTDALPTGCDINAEEIIVEAAPTP